MGHIKKIKSLWWAAAVAALMSGQGVVAQSWPNLDQLLFSTLTVSGTALATYWLPDQADPNAATQAIGIAYEHIPGSAGNFGISVGYYGRVGDTWQFLRPVEGVFGQDPRDPLFGPGWAELSTLTLGPNDARCCPSAVARWRIDLATGQGMRTQ